MNLDDVVTLDPAYAGETTNLFIHINTYDTLVDIRPDDLNTIVPRLAESWEVNDEFTEFIFHLRQDAKFASGNPVTAQDVVFSWNRLLNAADAATADKAKEWMDQNSAGSDPFILTRWDPKAMIELTPIRTIGKALPSSKGSSSRMCLIPPLNCKCLKRAMRI
jgi:peptide/nickel transport system substrate-binding protein